MVNRCPKCRAILKPPLQLCTRCGSKFPGLDHLIPDEPTILPSPPSRPFASDPPRPPIGAAYYSRFTLLALLVLGLLNGWVQASMLGDIVLVFVLGYLSRGVQESLHGHKAWEDVPSTAATLYMIAWLIILFLSRL